MTIDDILNSQSGDGDSTVKLIEKFNPLLKKYAYKLNYEDAYNDLLIDFIELLQSIKIDRIYNKNEGGIVSYICTSVHSSYIKKIKECQKLHNLSFYCDLDEKELYYIEMKSSTYDTYFNISFDFLLKSLTKSEYTVIKMIYYGGYTVPEIASYCGISRQAVNQMRNRALKKLKRVFSDKS